MLHVTAYCFVKKTLSTIGSTVILLTPHANVVVPVLPTNTQSEILKKNKSIPANSGIYFSKIGDSSHIRENQNFRVFFIWKLRFARKLWLNAHKTTFSHEEFQEESNMLRGKNKIKCQEPTRRHLGCAHRAS